MQINDDQLNNSTSAPADHPHDEHRVIADEWLRHAINGIKEMRNSEDARREVAQRLFQRPHIEYAQRTNGPNHSSAVALADAIEHEPGSRPDSSYCGCPGNSWRKSILRPA